MTVEMTVRVFPPVLFLLVKTLSPLCALFKKHGRLIPAKTKKNILLLESKKNMVRTQSGRLIDNAKVFIIITL